MNNRLFRTLMRLFPRHYRQERSGELLEAIEDTPATLRGQVRESLSLVWAACVAWSLHLKSRQAIRPALYSGATVWLGILVGVGSWSRLATTGTEYSRYVVSPGNERYAVVAAALSLGMLAFLSVSRIVAALLGVGALGASALVLQVGDFSIYEGLLYEARWVGVGLAHAIAAKGRRVSVGPSIVAVTIGLVPAVIIFGTEHLNWNPRLYSYSLRRLPDLLEISSHSNHQLLGLVRVVDFVWLGAVALLVLAPWFRIPIVAFFTPALVHWSVYDPTTGAIALFYVAAVLGVRFVRRNADITVRWRPQQ